MPLSELDSVHEQLHILEVLESRPWFTAPTHLLLQTSISTSRLQSRSKTDAVKYSGKVFAQVQPTSPKQNTLDILGKQCLFILDLWAREASEHT